MAHVPVVPIGKTREAVVDQATYDRELAGHEPLASRLDERRAEVQAGWGDKYADRVHEKDKLTTRERLDRLKDDGSEIFEVGTFVNYGVDFNGLRSPAAGVVTAFVQIEGRWCVVIANDNTVASGAWWPKTPEKIERAQEIARRLRLPTLYLVDCSGLYLPGAKQELRGSHWRWAHLQDEQPAVGRRRAANRRSVRGLHRRRRIHADHQRSRLHDRAGVHGHRRRGVDQRRQEPAHHLARHRRAGGARAPIGLRRRARSRRRDPDRLLAARGVAASELGRSTSTAVASSRWSRPFSRRASGPAPGRPSSGLRRDRDPRPPL